MNAKLPVILSSANASWLYICIVSFTLLNISCLLDQNRNPSFSLFATENQMQLWKRARWPWESLRITLSHGTGFCCKSVPCLLVLTVKWPMKQHCWKSGLNLCVHRLQGSGDRHGHQLDFHCAAAISGWCHGLGHDCSGYSGHWIRYVFSFCRF